MSTPASEFRLLGPLMRLSFSDVPAHLTAASNTTRTFPGLFGFCTAWWGRYQDRSWVRGSSSLTLLA